MSQQMKRLVDAVAEKEKKVNEKKGSASCPFFVLVPLQRRCLTVLSNSSFEKVLFFTQIDRLAHPWEWIFGAIKGF